MKKRTNLLLALLSIVIMLASTAMTSNAPRSIRFIGAQFIEGKGAVFHFETTGEFKQSDMKTAFAYGNGGDPLNVHCVVQSEKDRIACTVKDVHRYNNVLINITGLGFWADVPSKPACLGVAILAEGKEEAWIIPNGSEIFKEIQGGWEPITLEQFLEEINGTIVNDCVTDLGRFFEEPENPDPQ